jgi:signal transduction histidine kinase
MATTHPEFADACNQLKNTRENAELDYLVKEIPKTLKQSLEGVGRIARIVGSLKEFAHPGSPNPVPVNLNHAIATAIDVTRHEWKYVAKVKTELDANLPPVPCIVDQFYQIILNLIVNAAHAIEGHSPSVGIITVRTHHNENWAIVEIQDDGCGVPEELRKEIFQPFFTTKRSGKGTGQGLALVQKFVVKNHGGRVELESTEGKGSTFRIKLPLATGGNAKVPKNAVAA